MFTKKKAPSFEASEREPKGMKESGEKSEPTPPKGGKRCPECGQIMPAKAAPKKPVTSVKPAWKNVADQMMGKA